MEEKMADEAKTYGIEESNADQRRSSNDLRSAAEALLEAAQSMVRSGNQLTQLMQTMTSTPGLGMLQGQSSAAGQAPMTVQINTWEDDPFSEAVPTTNPPIATPVAANLPQNDNPRLQTTIVEPRPAPARYAPGIANFRYWATAEAITRGINFWASLLPAGTTWSTSNPMRITLVAGTDLNANYSRPAGLRFYHQVVQNRDIFSCESPDVACHELGHAVLDALKPQLFNAASAETGAFHESFGDMSGILSALQLQSVRIKVLAETGGRLDTNSRMSRLAEQLGWAIRQLAPDAVDRDCLRNAANRFSYRPPNTLPPRAPAAQLSSEVHSFSRVFTGAFLDALAGMFRISGAPNEANLLAITRDMGQLLVDGVHTAPISSAYYSSVAAAMIQADKARNGGKYTKALTSAFVGRSILSVHSALDVGGAPVPQQAPAAIGMGIAGDTGQGSPVILTYEGQANDAAYRLGQGQTPELPTIATSLGRELTVRVHAVEADMIGIFGFSVLPAVFGEIQAAPMSADQAANSFLEDLIQTGRVDVGAARGSLFDLSENDTAKTTHMLVPDPDNQGSLILKRKHFDCGFCDRIAGSPRLECI
jgi:hypothetical protein